MSIFKEPPSIENPLARVRRFLGWMLLEWHERGLEFAVAVATIINARATLFTTSEGRSLAPFLSSALDFLTREPTLWASFLATVGALHLMLVLLSFGRSWLFPRAIACMGQAMVYVAVSVAILTGPAPHQAGERYILTAWMTFWVGVALLTQAVAEWRETHKEARGEK